LVAEARFVYNYFLYKKKLVFKSWSIVKTTTDIDLKIYLEKLFTYEDMANKLIETKKHHTFLKNSNAQVLQQKLKDLDNAFTRFFKKEAEFPRFKKKGKHRDSLRFSQPSHLKISGDEVKIPKIKKQNRQLGRKQQGSRNYEKARIKLAKTHQKIADTRKDLIHKLTTMIINENQVIVMEDLNAKGMMKNKKLAKHIADAAFGEIKRQLEYKARWYNRTFVLIDRLFPSSKKCSTPGCSFVKKDLKLSHRKWRCPVCNVLHDRDNNASVNIVEEGLRILYRDGTARIKACESGLAESSGNVFCRLILRSRKPRCLQRGSSCLPDL